MPEPTLPAMLLHHAREHGDRVAFDVVVGEDTTRLTWRALAAQAGDHAQRLAAAGVRPGDVVVVCLRHGSSLYPSFLGAMLCGAVPSFIPFPTPRQNPVLHWDEHLVLFELWIR